MRIVTTPMCEEVVKLAGIKEYNVNKNPDLEEGDLAILLSESKVKMDAMAIKLNTPKQLFDSIKEVSKLSDKELSDSEILSFFKDYELCLKYLDNHDNSNIKVKIYSNFLKDIILNIGFKISDDDFDLEVKTARKLIYKDEYEKEIENRIYLPRLSEESSRHRGHAGRGRQGGL